MGENSCGGSDKSGPKVKPGRRDGWVPFPCSAGLDFLVTELIYKTVVAEVIVQIFVW